jgi:asparagine synthase (glutamine-hydrolysing)
MCGISGVVYHDRHRTVSPTELRSMCDTLIHRGPDDQGMVVDGNIGLGMRRLKVIDLVTGDQPISNEDGRIWIVFNGEIYNYPELRKALEQKGHTFSTHTDTETIVHAYEEYGEDCVNQLNGMFAFAIWDGRCRKLLLARDRLGIKPLYYFVNDRCLIFGSELKALLQHPEVPRAIDLEALDRFLTCEYIPAPRSIFQDIHKLLPGHILMLQEGHAAIRQYWDLRFHTVEEPEAELGDALYDLLQDAVRMRLVSDVPLGALLSGGIDSSSIVCLMSEIMDQPVQTFCIGFDDPSYNESTYARRVAAHFGTEHHELTIQPDVVTLVEGLVRYLDEPLADVSVFPTYLVSQLARRQVTVVLSGDGGDELFAGYDWYIAAQMARYYRHLPAAVRTGWLPRLLDCMPPTARKKGLVNKLKRFVEGARLPAALQHFCWNIFMSEATKRHLYTEDLQRLVAPVEAYADFIAYLLAAEAADPLWQQQYADIKTFLVDDILVKVDRMSMANSLEVRTPFLDYRVVEFAAGLPSHLKLRGWHTKYVLKQCMATRLPGEILTRRKEGFSIPMKNWLRQELSPLMQDVLSPARLKREGLFNPAYVDKLKAEHLQGTANHSHQLWSLMMFEIWREAYLDSSGKTQPCPRDQ